MLDFWAEVLWLDSPLKNFLRENHDHLLFVSYPCGFAKFANRRIDDWPEKLESGHLVQCFNIVLLDLEVLFFCFAGEVTGTGMEWCNLVSLYDRWCLFMVPIASKGSLLDWIEGPKFMGNRGEYICNLGGYIYHPPSMVLSTKDGRSQSRFLWTVRDARVCTVDISGLFLLFPIIPFSGLNRWYSWHTT